MIKEIIENSLGEKQVIIYAEDGSFLTMPLKQYEQQAALETPLVIDEASAE